MHVLFNFFRDRRFTDSERKKIQMKNNTVPLSYVMNGFILLSGIVFWGLSVWFIFGTSHENGIFRGNVDSTEVHVTTNLVRNNKNVEMDKTKIQCAWDQQIVTASLLLDTNITSITPEEKVAIINQWSDFLNQSPYSITLRPKYGGKVTNLQDTKILIAGSGDVDHKSIYEGVELTWLISCGEFHQHRAIEFFLTHNIENGNVKNILGYRVIGWYVSANIPFGRAHVIGRKKQAVSMLRTAIATPIMPSVVATAAIMPTVSLSYVPTATPSIAGCVRQLPTSTESLVHETAATPDLNRITEL